MKMKKKLLLSSVAVIALCICVIAGSTYALFTDTAEVNVAVTAGDLDVSAEVDPDSIKMRSLGDAANTFPRELGATDESMQKFENGGTAVYANNVLTVSKMTPGDAVRFDLTIANSNAADAIAVKYKFNWTIDEDQIDDEGRSFLDVLEFTVYEKNADGSIGNAIANPDSSYRDLAVGERLTYVVELVFADDNGNDANNDGITDNNEYKGTIANINFLVEAIQPNGVS